jgi:hypothetical protein
MAEIVTPCVIRCEIITDNLVKFGGRHSAEFLSPDPMTVIDRLPLVNPGDLRDLYTLSIDDIIDYLVELGDFLQLSKNELMRECMAQSIDMSDHTPSVLKWQYDMVKPYLSRDMVRGYIDTPIGIPYVEGWQEHKLPDGRTAAIRAMGARALHITAGNSPMVALLTIARNALTRSDAIIKSPSNDPFTAVAIARSMIRMAPDHPITKHVSVGYWKGGNEEFEQLLYQPKNVEKIVAWGGFASVKHVTKYVQPGLELISLDPKRSATIIAKDAFADERTMREVAVRVAADMGAANQMGCSAARVVLVESGTDDAGLEKLRQLGEMVYASLLALPETVSTKARIFDPELRNEIQALRATPDFYDVIGGRDDEGGVIVSRLDDAVDFYPMLSGRVINLVPLDSIDDANRFINGYTQTIGIYPESLKKRLRDELPLWGAQRLVSLGYANSIYAGLPQDAIEPVRRMVKWIVEETCSPDCCPPLWEHKGEEAAEAA